MTSSEATPPLRLHYDLLRLRLSTLTLETYVSKTEEADKIMKNITIEAVAAKTSKHCCLEAVSFSPEDFLSFLSSILASRKKQMKKNKSSTAKKAARKPGQVYMFSLSLMADIEIPSDPRGTNARPKTVYE